MSNFKQTVMEGLLIVVGAIVIVCVLIEPFLNLPAIWQQAAVGIVLIGGNLFWVWTISVLQHSQHFRSRRLTRLGQLGKKTLIWLLS